MLEDEMERMQYPESSNKLEPATQTHVASAPPPQQPDTAETVLRLSPPPLRSRSGFPRWPLWIYFIVGLCLLVGFSLWVLDHLGEIPRLPTTFSRLPGPATFASTSDQATNIALTKDTNAHVAPWPSRPVDSMAVVSAFKTAGLEAEKPSMMGLMDSNLMPYYITSLVIFSMPSLCLECGGRVYSFASEADTEKLKEAEYGFATKAPSLNGWVFTKGLVLVEIYGHLLDEQARKYDTALQAMK
jgi:hypothetical protein